MARDPDLQTTFDGRETAQQLTLVAAIAREVVRAGGARP
jgi:hypothetical protein